MPGAFRALLTPHRSLGPTGFLVLMAALAGISFVTGLVFYLAGAWPVMGFFGLDVALVYLAFRLNYRSGAALRDGRADPGAIDLDQGAPLRAARAVRLQPLLGAREPARVAGRAHGP